jgi:hypothetical protein
LVVVGAQAHGLGEVRLGLGMVVDQVVGSGHEDMRGADVMRLGVQLALVVMVVMVGWG